MFPHWSWTSRQQFSSFKRILGLNIYITLQRIAQKYILIHTLDFIANCMNVKKISVAPLRQSRVFQEASASFHNDLLLKTKKFVNKSKRRQTNVTIGN